MITRRGATVPGRSGRVLPARPFVPGSRPGGAGLSSGKVVSGRAGGDSIREDVVLPRRRNGGLVEAASNGLHGDRHEPRVDDRRGGNPDEQQKQRDRQDEGEDTVWRHVARRRHRIPPGTGFLHTVYRCGDSSQPTRVSGIVSRKNGRNRGACAIGRASSTRVRRRATSCGRNGTTSAPPRSRDRRSIRTWRGTPAPLFRRGSQGKTFRKRHAGRGRRRRPCRFSAVGSGLDRRGRTARPSTGRRPGDDRRRNPRSLPAGGWPGPDRGRERTRLS